MQAARADAIVVDCCFVPMFRLRLRSRRVWGRIGLGLTLLGCSGPGSSGETGGAATPGGPAPALDGSAGEQAGPGSGRDMTTAGAEPNPVAGEGLGQTGADGLPVLDTPIPELPGAGGAGASDGSADASATPTPVTPGSVRLYLAGDSIVQSYADTASDRDQAGWGQMLVRYFDAAVTIDNHAIGGRTARRFIDEGRLDEILDVIQPGEYLLVQFGTNDGNRTATYTLGQQTIPYFLEPASDFKAYLQQYVDGARTRGAVPILVTPTPRNSAYCTGGNGTGGHAQAIRELGQAEDVPVVDLNLRAVDYLQAICPAPTPEDFFLLRADGTVDGTHFQENGARILAGFVAEGLRGSGLPLVQNLKPGP
jgi:lysophospholipase L1-like esterase